MTTVKRPPAGTVQRAVDPLERIIPLSLKLLLYVFLSIYLYQAATMFYEYRPGQQWPFLLWLIRNSIFLFIHEGGHGLFMFFGKVLHALGGSFWQIMFPVLSFLIALRKRSHVVAPFALFWAGANMLDVSLYMRDAPKRVLPLLGPRSGHDWFYLFTRFGVTDSAGLIADIVYFAGMVVCIGSIAAGCFLALQRFRGKLPEAAQVTAVAAPKPQSDLSRSLENALRQKEKDDRFGGM